MSNWYYARNGKPYGPYTFDELRGLADARHLQKSDLVCQDGGMAWLPASSFVGLFLDVASVPPSSVEKNPLYRPTSVSSVIVELTVSSVRTASAFGLTRGGLLAMMIGLALTGAGVGSILVVRMGKAPIPNDAVAQQQGKEPIPLQNPLTEKDKKLLAEKEESEKKRKEEQEKKPAPPPPPQEVQAVRVVWEGARDGQALVKSMNPLQLVSVISTGIDIGEVYCVSVKFTNIGNTHLKISHQNLQITHQGRVCSVRTMAHPRFFQNCVLAPGKTVEGVLMFAAPPKLGELRECCELIYYEKGVKVEYGNP